MALLCFVYYVSAVVVFVCVVLLCVFLCISRVVSCGFLLFVFVLLFVVLLCVFAFSLKSKFEIQTSVLINDFFSGELE